jgi:hypothetical protein
VLNLAAVPLISRGALAVADERMGYPFVTLPEVKALRAGYEGRRGGGFPMHVLVPALCKRCLLKPARHAAGTVVRAGSRNLW